MSNRHYGSNYDSKLSTKEIAALIRAEIKRRVKANELPEWKYSVRYRSFAGGTAIDVVATSPHPTMLCQPGYYFASKDADRDVELPIDGQWRPCRIRAGESWHVARKDVEHTTVTFVRQQLQALMDSYNHDGSDIMTDYFDVNFYGHANVEAAGGWRHEYEREVPFS